MAGGKRVHPVLYIADCGLGIGKEETANPLAFAVKMSHTIDHVDLLRGRHVLIVYALR
jgi:hypothetical protein